MLANQWLPRTVAPNPVCLPIRAVAVSIMLTTMIATAAAQPNDEAEPFISHSAPINSAIYSPDGSLIATASSDQLIKLWKSATREELRTLQGHTGQVLSLAITSDNRTLYSGAADNTIRQWDLPRSGPLHRFEGHTASVSDVVIGPDSRQAVTSSVDKSLRLWDLETNKIVAIWEGHRAEVARLAYRADGNEVASGDIGGTVIVWNILTGEPLVEIGAHAGEVTGVAYHPNNTQLITTGADGLMQVWQLPVRAARPIGDLVEDIRAIDITGDSQTAVIASGEALQAVTVSTGAVLRNLEGLTGEPTAVDISPNNALVATATVEGAIQLHNLADGAERGRIDSSNAPINDVAFHSASERLATAGADGTIRLWRLPMPAIPLPGNAADALRTAAAPDGSYVVTTGADNSVRMFDPTSGAAIRQLVGHETAVAAVSLLPDAAQLVTADASGELRHWNATDASLLARHGGHKGEVTATAVHPTGKLLATAGADGTVKRWPLPLPPPTTLAGNTETVTAVAIAADKTFAITASADKSLRKFDASTGVQSLAFEGHDESISSVALAASDSLVIAGQADGAIRVWHADGKPWSGPLIAEPADPAVMPSIAVPATLFGHAGAVKQISVHDETKRFATAGADGSVRIWRLPTAPTELVGGMGEISKHVVSNDRRLSASAGMVGERPAVFIHDLAGGKLLHTLLGHSAPITAIAFNQDGTQVASGSSDNTARVWNLAEAKFPEQHSLPQPEAVSAIAFDSTGEQLLVATADNTIRQWSLADGTETQAITGHSGAIAALAVHETTLFSAAADSTVRSWNLTNGAAIRSINHGAAVRSLAITSDGTTIASGGADNDVKLWNAADGSPITTFSAHGTPVDSLSFLPDGGLLVSGSAAMACLWELESNLLLQSFPLGEWESIGAGFGVDLGDPNVTAGLSGLRIVIAGTEGSLRVAQPDLLQRLVGHEGEVTGVQFTLDGNAIVTSGADNTIRRWELVDAKVAHTYSGPTDGVTSLSLSADGDTLAAACLDQNVYLWSITEEVPATGQPTPPAATIPIEAAANCVALSQDGTRLAIGSADSLVRIWDIATNRELERFFAHTDVLSAIAISPDGRTVVSGGADKLAQLLTSSGQIIHSSDDTQIHDLGFTPDATQLIGVGNTAQLIAWPFDEQLVVGDSVQIPPTETKPDEWSPLGKLRLAISPNGNELAVLDTGGRVDRWNLATGTLLSGIEASGNSPADDEASVASTGCLAYNPDGSQIAIGTGRQIRLVDSTSGRQLESISVATPANDLSFVTADRMSIAATGNESQASLIDRALVRWWVADENEATSIIFSPDGASLLSGGANGQVSLWNVEQGTLIRKYAGVTSAVTDTAIAPDGSRVVVSSDDGFVRTWPMVPPADAAADTAVVAAVEWDLGTPVRTIGISADNLKLTATADDNVLRLFDLALGQPVQQWPLVGSGQVARIAADNKTIVVGGLELAASAVEINVSQSMAVAAAPVTNLALYNNGTLAATSSEGKISIWNLANSQLVREIETASGISSLAVRADNAQLAAVDTDNKLHFWNLADGTETTQFSLPASVNRLHYSIDNQKLVAAMSDGGLRFYSPTDGTLLYELTDEKPLTALAITADSRRVVSGGAEGAVALWSYAAPAATRTFTGHGGNVYSLALSPDNTMIASASADQSIRLWDTESGNQLRSLTGHVGPVYCVAFSPDGALLVSCGEDNSIRLWDVLGGRQLKQIPASEKSLYSVAFHPDGQLVATAGLDKKVLIYDVLAGTLKTTIEGHDDYIYRVAYNTAGNRLVSCGYGGTTIYWNAANGQKLFEETTGRVSNFIDLSPDDSRMIVAGGDGRVHFLEVPATAK